MRQNTRLPFIILPFIILIFAVAAFLMPAIAQASPKTYVSNQGFQLNPPAGWRIDTSGTYAPFVLFAPTVGKFAPNMNVNAKKSDTDFPLSDVGPDLTARFQKQFKNYHQISQHQTTIAGHPALETVGTYTLDTLGIPTRIDQYIVKTSGHIYIFTLTAPAASSARYETAFAAILKSVKVKE